MTSENIRAAGVGVNRKDLEKVGRNLSLVDDFKIGDFPGNILYQKEFWDIIVINSFSELGSARKAIDFIEDIKRYNKDIISIGDKIDTRKSHDFLLIKFWKKIHSLREKPQKNSLGILIKKGMKKKAKNGKFQGFATPYGYNYKNKKLVTNRREAKWVRKIFELYCKGYSLGKLADLFNERGVPTKRGGSWAKQTIASIIKNPIYCGYVEWDDTVAKGGHSPIVSIQTFEKANSILKGKKLQ